MLKLFLWMMEVYLKEILIKKIEESDIILIMYNYKSVKKTKIKIFISYYKI
jgi:hypothetical protein